jgi:hypothetical protein
MMTLAVLKHSGRADEVGCHIDGMLAAQMDGGTCRLSYEANLERSSYARRSNLDCNLPDDGNLSAHPSLEQSGDTNASSASW